MAKLVKVFQTLRNNWKKTVFGTAAVTYGVNYGLDKYEHAQMMRAYCEVAREIGEAPLPVEARARHVTVILNPAANKRKAKKEFEEYCAPLLHLAGLSVNIVLTGKEGQARSLMEKLEEATDAIVVAGGDGTLSEAVTGLLRREDGTQVAKKIPFGVLPLGKTNSVAKQLFSQSADDRIKHLAEATMAVIFEVTKPLDVIKFQVMPTESTEVAKPVYSLVGMEWGAFRDAHARREKYWYFGGLRGYASYLFTGLKDEKSGITWQVEANMEYTPPCEGCSNCYNQRYDLHPEIPQNKSWWSGFAKRTPGTFTPQVDYKGKLNEKCGKVEKLEVKTTDFSLLSSNVLNDHSKVPRLQVSYGPDQVTFNDFVQEGWRRENGVQPLRTNTLTTKDVKIWPLNNVSLGGSEAADNVAESSEEGAGAGAGGLQGPEKWISIDNEDYEVKAVQATLLPNIIKIFCSPQFQIN